jgi:hypothetical protein
MLARLEPLCQVGYLCVVCVLGIFKIGPLELFAGAGFQLQSS